MSEEKKKYPIVDGTSCFYCDRGRLEFVSLESDDIWSEYDSSEVVEILLKGHHLANFICKRCGEKTQAWDQYRKPYPEYDDKD